MVAEIGMLQLQASRDVVERSHFDSAGVRVLAICAAYNLRGGVRPRPSTLQPKGGKCWPDPAPGNPPLPIYVNEDVLNDVLGE